MMALRPPRVSRWYWLVIVAANGCASPRVAQRCVANPEHPALQTHSIAWHLFTASAVTPVVDCLNVPRVLKRLAGRPVASCDLRDGAVPETTFFTNRPIAQLSPEMVRWGPTDPAQRPHPPFTVTRLKGEGKEAGCFVTDARGHRFLLKFDVPGYAELSTGAEVVASKLVYALGYWVPSYEIVEVRAEELQFAPSVSDEAHALLRQALRVRAQADGRVQACASRFLDGKILGPFRFDAYRDCAELRALRLAYAWLNNTDTKDQNTLMVQTDHGLIGYLIDFGSALGANAEHGTKGPCEGWRYDVDLPGWMWRALTLGIARPRCDATRAPHSPAIGLFSSDFDPTQWRPYAPNIAFREMTRADAAWMAHRLAQLSRVQIEAAVSAGQYHDHEDARYLVNTLEARRHAILVAYGAESPRFRHSAPTSMVGATEEAR